MDVKVEIALTFTSEYGHERTHRYNFDEVRVEHERGNVKTLSLGECTDIRPNGHERMIIKAWSGCKDYDSFILEQMITEE